MVVRDGYKVTEVGVLPEDWEVVTLGSLMSFKNGANSSRDKYGKGIKFVNVLDIISGNPITYNSIIGKVDLTNTEKAAYKIQFGDILFQRSSETIEDAAQSNVYSDKDNFAAFGGFVIAGRKVSDYNPFYVNYQLKSKGSRSELISRCGGSTRYNIGQGGLSKVQIPLPPTKSEQTAIATALGDVDGWIRSLVGLLGKKELVKVGVMGALLTAGEGWREVELGEILTIRHGKSQKQVIDENGEYPILASGGIIGYASSYLYNKPSVLIGRKGTIDVPRFMDTPFCSVDTLFYSEIHDGYDPLLVFYLFKLINWYDYNEASGVPSLNAKTIHTIEVSVPPTLAEQQEISSI